MVIDLNVWISALINPGGVPGRLVKKILQTPGITIVISAQMVDEIEGVLKRPKFSAMQLDADWLRKMLDEIKEVQVESLPVSPIRDPDDEPVVAAAIRGSASLVVSGDRDFTDDPELKLWLHGHGISVYGPAEALELLERLFSQRHAP